MDEYMKADSVRESVRGGRPSRHRACCPRCGVRLLRVSRTSLDMLFNIMVPVHRYSCTSLACQWGGLLRTDRGHLPARDRALVHRHTIEVSDL